MMDAKNIETKIAKNVVEIEKRNPKATPISDMCARESESIEYLLTTTKIPNDEASSAIMMPAKNARCINP